MKNYKLTWLITEIIGLVLIIVVCAFEIYTNYPLFVNPSVTFNQKLINVIGVLTVCYGWGILLKYLVVKMRKVIRKYAK